MPIKAIRVWSVFVVSVTLSLLSACAGMTEISGPSRTELIAESRAALDELYAATPATRELWQRASAVLVFPDIVKAGLLVGGSGGNGVLFSPSGSVLGYYNATSVSYGLQAGAQSYSQAMFLMNPEALAYLEDSAGWSVGAGPSVVVADMGVAKELSSTTMQRDVFAFIYGQEGVMGGIGLQGQKITKLQPALP